MANISPLAPRIDALEYVDSNQQAMLAHLTSFMLFFRFGRLQRTASDVSCQDTSRIFTRLNSAVMAVFLCLAQVTAQPESGIGSTPNAYIRCVSTRWIKATLGWLVSPCLQTVDSSLLVAWIKWSEFGMLSTAPCWRDWRATKTASTRSPLCPTERPWWVAVWTRRSECGNWATEPRILASKCSLAIRTLSCLSPRRLMIAGLCLAQKTAVFNFGILAPAKHNSCYKAIKTQVRARVELQ